jgi:hypothetical protein
MNLRLVPLNDIEPTPQTRTSVSVRAVRAVRAEGWLIALVRTSPCHGAV